MSDRPAPELHRRDLLRMGLGLGAAAALSSCAYLGDPATNAAAAVPPAKAKIDGDLVYYNWGDYLDPGVLKGFQQEYGVRIIESNFDSMEGMMAKLNAGNQYDVIFPGAKVVDQLRKQGKLQKIDKEQLTNAAQVFGRGTYFDDPWYDPGSEHSVPFTVYKTGLAYRKDKVTGLSNSWADLWNESAAGRIYTLDQVDEALAMAALRLGYDINTAAPDELDAIKELLLSQKPLLRGYSSDDIKNMASGDAWIHHMWSGDYLYLVQYQVDDPSLYEFVAPSEGTPINSDAYAIPANAEHPGTAMVFIDYVLRPENAIKNIKYLGYPMPIKDAEATFSKMTKDFPACEVSLDDLNNPLVFQNMPIANVRARNAVWTEVKAS